MVKLDTGVVGCLHRPRELHEFRRAYDVGHDHWVRRATKISHLDTLVFGPLRDVLHRSFEAYEFPVRNAASDVVNCALTDALGDIHLLVDRVVVHLLFDSVERRIGEFLTENQTLGLGVGEVTSKAINTEFEPSSAEHPDTGDSFPREETALEDVA